MHFYSGSVINIANDLLVFHMFLTASNNHPPKLKLFERSGNYSGSRELGQTVHSFRLTVHVGDGLNLFYRVSRELDLQPTGLSISTLPVPGLF